MEFSSSKNTGVGSLSLLRGSPPTRGSSPGFHCRETLHHDACGGCSSAQTSLSRCLKWLGSWVRTSRSVQGIVGISVGYFKLEKAMKPGPVKREMAASVPQSIRIGGGSFAEIHPVVVRSHDRSVALWYFGVGCPQRKWPFHCGQTIDVASVWQVRTLRDHALAVSLHAHTCTAALRV